MLTEVHSLRDEARKARSQVPQSCKVQTPHELAVAIVRRLGDAPTAKWLEPSCGEGAFLYALDEAGVPRERITGVDLDESESPEDSKGSVLRGMDFLPWSLENRGTFDRVVGNPPFARLSALESPLREAAMTRVAKLGIPVSGTSNYWVPFLLASLDCLRRGGSFGFILPAAWEFASYATSVRSMIGSLFTRVEVHRSRRPLFPDRQDGNVVLICEGYYAGSCTPSRFEHEDAQSLVDMLETPDCKRVVSRQKNTQQRRRRATHTIPVRSIMSIRIGAVTGDNTFFLLTEGARREKNLPRSSLVPVVSRANQIRQPDLTGRDWGKLRDSGERIWLFRPSQRDLEHPAVRVYLEHGGCDRSRYKISSRQVWHQTPLPEMAHGFMSGMSKESPWICLNRSRSVTATNTLYVVRFAGNLLLKQKAAWALALLHPIARETARENARRYADGLEKLEPSDILQIPLVVPITYQDAVPAYQEALGYLLNGDQEKCQQVAEHWFRDQLF